MPEPNLGQDPTKSGPRDSEHAHSTMNIINTWLAVSDRNKMATWTVSKFMNCVSCRWFVNARKTTTPILCTVRGYGIKKESRPWKQKPNRKVRMKIILTEDVPNLGSKGQLCRVKRGYGRNELIPSGKAIYATHYNVKKYDITEEELRGKVKRTKAYQIDFLAKYLRERTLVVRQDPEEPNWEVIEQDLSRAFYSSLQLHVPLDLIILKEPIVEFGETQVEVQLQDDLIIPVKVNVVQYVDSKTQRKRARKQAASATGSAV